MRGYCANCGREVDSQLTGGQVTSAVLLFLLLLIGLLIWIPVHARKCPFCKSEICKLGNKPI